MSDDDDNLLNRRIKKAISMMRLPRTLDDDGICTRCGVPDVHDHLTLHPEEGTDE